MVDETQNRYKNERNHSITGRIMRQVTSRPRNDANQRLHNTRNLGLLTCI